MKKEAVTGLIDGLYESLLNWNIPVSYVYNTYKFTINTHRIRTKLNEAMGIIKAIDLLLGDSPIVDGKTYLNNVVDINTQEQYKACLIKLVILEKLVETDGHPLPLTGYFLG